MEDTGNVVEENKDKAELLARTFVKEHSSETLSNDGKRQRERTIDRNIEAPQDNKDDENMSEVNRAISKAG